MLMGGNPDKMKSDQQFVSVTTVSKVISLPDPQLS